MSKGRVETDITPPTSSMTSVMMWWPNLVIRLKLYTAPDAHLRFSDQGYSYGVDTASIWSHSDGCKLRKSSFLMLISLLTF